MFARQGKHAKEKPVKKVLNDRGIKNVANAAHKHPSQKKSGDLTASSMFISIHRGSIVEKGIYKSGWAKNSLVGPCMSGDWKSRDLAMPGSGMTPCKLSETKSMENEEKSCANK